MRHLHRFLSCALFLGLAAQGQSIDLRGVVKNRAGAALPGVAVALVASGERDTTDAQGRFQILKGPTGTAPSIRFRSAHPPEYLPHEGIRFEHPQAGEVVVRIRDLTGRLVQSARADLGAGTWTLPLAHLPMGTFVGQLEDAGGGRSFRFASVATRSSSSRSATGAIAPSAAFRQLAAAADSLRATKNGYKTATIAVSSLTDSTVSIVLDTAATTGSEGCGKSATRPDPASKQTLSVSGTNRTYLLFLPTNYSSTTEYPVVFAFHGGGGNGAAARNDFKLEAAANNGAIMVYPDGGWNYGSGTDVAFFDAILKDMKAKYCLNTKRVFVTGFSLGGIFVNGLGCLRGGTTVRAIIPVAGSGPNPNMAPAQADIGCPTGTPPSDVPTMIIHGTADANALYKYGQWEAEFWRKWNGASTTTTTPPSPFSGCVDYSGGRVPVRFCTHSGGHMVPSWAGQYIWSFAQSIQ